MLINIQKKVFCNINKSKVLLLIKIIGIDWSSKKLDHKTIGFFEIIGKKNILLEL